MYRWWRGSDHRDRDELMARAEQVLQTGQHARSFYMGSQKWSDSPGRSEVDADRSYVRH